jgi:hypothetical protein
LTAGNEYEGGSRWPTLPADLVAKAGNIARAD